MELKPLENFNDCRYVTRQFLGLVLIPLNADLLLPCLKKFKGCGVGSVLWVGRPRRAENCVTLLLDFKLPRRKLERVWLAWFCLWYQGVVYGDCGGEGE